MSKTMISIFAALLLAVLGTTGCNKSKLEKAHKAAATISRVLTIAGTVIEQLGREQLLDDQEALKLSDAVNDLKRAVAEFNAAAARFQETPESTAELIQALSEVSRQVEALHKDGVLHVKNPEAKQKLSRILAGISVSLEVIAAALESS